MKTRRPKYGVGDCFKTSNDAIFLITVILMTRDDEYKVGDFLVLDRDGRSSHPELLFCVKSRGRDGSYVLKGLIMDTGKFHTRFEELLVMKILYRPAEGLEKEKAFFLLKLENYNE